MLATPLIGSMTAGQGLGMLGLGGSALGSLSAGNAQAAAATYNAKAEQIQAQEAQSQANAQAQLQAQTTKRQLGSVAANYGASGVDPTQGTPLAVMYDQASQGELARQLDLYRGQVSATNSMNQAALDAAQAPIYQAAALTKGGGTLLTGMVNLFGDT